MGLFTRLAAHDNKVLAERRATFVSQFNRPDVAPLGSEDLPGVMETARATVCAELAKPLSAEFEETFVRHCSDEVIRAAGIVRFAGRADQISSTGYLVEFSSEGQPELLEFVDFDPVTLKHPSRPEISEEGVLPYEATGQSEDAGLPWRVVVVLIVTIVCLAFLLVNAILR